MADISKINLNGNEYDVKDGDAISASDFKVHVHEFGTFTINVGVGVWKGTTTPLPTGATIIGVRRIDTGHNDVSIDSFDAQGGLTLKNEGDTAVTITPKMYVLYI